MSSEHLYLLHEEAVAIAAGNLSSAAECTECVMWRFLSARLFQYLRKVVPVAAEHLLEPVARERLIEDEALRVLAVVGA